MLTGQRLTAFHFVILSMFGSPFCCNVQDFVRKVLKWLIDFGVSSM